MARKPEKITVRGHERTGPDGSTIKVSGYERLKGGRPQPPLLEATTLAPIRGTQIVTRDPNRHGQVQAQQGVQIVGKNNAPGVNRVNR